MSVWAVLKLSQTLLDAARIQGSVELLAAGLLVASTALFAAIGNFDVEHVVGSFQRKSIHAIGFESQAQPESLTLVADLLHNTAGGRYGWSRRPGEGNCFIDRPEQPVV